MYSPSSRVHFNHCSLSMCVCLWLCVCGLCGCVFVLFFTCSTAMLYSKVHSKALEFISTATYHASQAIVLQMWALLSAKTAAATNNAKNYILRADIAAYILGKYWLNCQKQYHLLLLLLLEQMLVHPCLSGTPQARFQSLFY